ncbi:MAG: hypothetical protein KAJ91_01875 [Candidatus Aenigmarchaeota archaeon]|nr:hypothetical protein [Candidatus Aenigmarchaeota archaeon]
MAAQETASFDADAKLKKLEDEKKSLEDKNKSLAEIIELSATSKTESPAEPAVDTKTIEQAIDAKLNDFKKDFSLLEKKISSQKKEPSVSPQQINDLSSKFATIEDRLKVLDRIPDLEKKVTETTEASKKSSEEKDGLFGDMGAFDEEASGSLFGKGSAPRSLRVVDRSLQKMDETTDARFRHFEKKLDELAQRLSPRAVKSLEKMATSGEKILQEVVPNEVKAEVDRIVNSFSFEIRGVSDTVRKLSQDTESINSETRKYVEKLQATEERMKAFRELAEQLKQDEGFIDRMKMAERLKHDEILISKLKKDLELMQKKVSIEKIRGLEERIESLEPIADRLDQGEIMIENVNAKTEQLEKKIAPAEKIRSLEKQVVSFNDTIDRIMQDNSEAVGNMKKELESRDVKKAEDAKKTASLEKRLKSVDKMAEKLIQNEANIEKLVADVQQQEKQGASIDAVRALEGRMDLVDTLAGNLRDDVRHVKTRVETGLGETPLTKLFGIKKGKVILHSIDKMAERLEKDETLIERLNLNLRQLSKTGASIEKVDAVEKQLASFEKGMNHALVDSVASVDIMKKELEAINVKKAEDSQKAKALRARIDAIGEMSEKIIQNETKLKELKSTLCQQSKENAPLAKVNALEARITSCEKHNDSLNKERTHVEKLKQDLWQTVNRKANARDITSVEARIHYIEDIIGKLKSEDARNIGDLKESLEQMRLGKNAHTEKIKHLEGRMDSFGNVVERFEMDEVNASKLHSNIEQMKKNIPVQRIIGIEEKLNTIGSTCEHLNRELAQANKKIDNGRENSVLSKLFGIKKGKEILDSAKKTAEHIEKQKALIGKLNADIEQISKSKAGTEDLNAHEAKINALEELVDNFNAVDTKNIVALKEEIESTRAHGSSHNEKIVGLEYRMDSLEKSINKVRDVDSDRIEDLSEKVDCLKKTKKSSISKSLIQKLVNVRKGKKSDDAFEELEMLFRQGVISRKSFEDGMKKLFPQEGEEKPCESHARHSAFDLPEPEAILVPSKAPLPEEHSDAEICHYRSYQRMPHEED